MKKLLTALVLSGLTFGLPVASFAKAKAKPSDAPAPAAAAPATPAAPAPAAPVTPPAPAPAAIADPAPAKAPKPFPFNGTVSGVDAAARTFTMTSKKGHVRTFHVGADVPVKNEETDVDFSAIKVSSYVTGLTTKISADNYQVVNAKVGEKPAAKAGKKAAAAAAPSAAPKTN